jgi:hypothetical protein
VCRVACRTQGLLRVTPIREHILHRENTLYRENTFYIQQGLLVNDIHQHLGKHEKKKQNVLLNGTDEKRCMHLPTVSWTLALSEYRCMPRSKASIAPASTRSAPIPPALS